MKRKKLGERKRKGGRKEINKQNKKTDTCDGFYPKKYGEKGKPKGKIEKKN